MLMSLTILSPSLLIWGCSINDNLEEEIQRTAPHIEYICNYLEDNEVSTLDALFIVGVLLSETAVSSFDDLEIIREYVEGVKSQTLSRAVAEGYE